MDDLRSDIIDRARRLSRMRNKNHPWLTMTDEEILRSSGLILKDSEKVVDGLTLAAILLFGKDETIMAALPQHKTDAILREIFSNSLAHRDYSTGYVAKFVIEKDKMYTENGNLSHGHGELKLDRFEPFSKNPPIAKVFREVSLADELESGMRNTYKYTKLYSGGVPEFIEGDVFKTIIPLSSAVTSMVGPDGNQDTPQDNLQDKVNQVV